jgi:hypothetical protein
MVGHVSLTKCTQHPSECGNDIGLVGQLSTCIVVDRFLILREALALLAMGQRVYHPLLVICRHSECALRLPAFATIAPVETDQEAARPDLTIGVVGFPPDSFGTCEEALGRREDEATRRECVLLVAPPTRGLVISQFQGCQCMHCKMCLPRCFAQVSWTHHKR